MERVTRPESGAEIAGFLQRIFAALIDTALLGLVFVFGVIGTLGWFAPEALLAQTVISLAYFAILNSGIAGGATLGKRLMGIRVVNRAGDTIGLGRSLWRSAFDMIPSSAASVPLVLPDSGFPFAAVAGALGGGFGLTNVYLYCFNWETRQVLHDLIARTFVVQEATCDRPFAGHTRWGHVAFAVVLVSVSAYVGTKVRQFQQAVQGRPVCVQPIKDAVQSLPFVERVRIDVNPWQPDAGFDPKQRKIWVYVRDGQFVPDARATARKVLAACPIMRDDDRLTILVVPPHKDYSLVPTLRTFPATVKEWRDSFAFEGLIRRQEGRCDIVQAVASLPGTARVSVADSYLSREDRTTHVKRIDVALTAQGVALSAFARQAVRMSLSACAGMDDSTVLNVVVTPGDGRRQESFPGTVHEWRSSVAFEDQHKSQINVAAPKPRRWQPPPGLTMPVPNGQ